MVELRSLPFLERSSLVETMMLDVIQYLNMYIPTDVGEIHRWLHNMYYDGMQQPPPPILEITQCIPS